MGLDSEHAKTSSQILSNRKILYSDIQKITEDQLEYKNLNITWNGSILLASQVVLSSKIKIFSNLGTPGNP